MIDPLERGRGRYEQDGIRQSALYVRAIQLGDHGLHLLKSLDVMLNAFRQDVTNYSRIRGRAGNQIAA